MPGMADVLQMLGAILILVAFAANQRGALGPHARAYLVLNLLGSAVLAWVALAFLFSAIYARLSRAQILETLSEDFVRTARAKGLPKALVYRRHALRAAITPLVTIAGLDIGAALGGTVITETTFGLQGLGRTAVDAVRSGDLPTIMATVLVSAFFIVTANLVVDLLYAAIDPRVRLGS